MEGLVACCICAQCGLVPSWAMFSSLFGDENPFDQISFGALTVGFHL